MSNVSNETFRRVLRGDAPRVQETGPRVKCTFTFPNLRGYDRVVIANALIAKFGGYSAHEGEGGWMHPDTGAIIERTWVFNVSFNPSRAKRDWCKDFAERVGRDTGQTWMHIEFSRFRAGHVMVRR